jgi:hypothetical protein
LASVRCLRLITVLMCLTRLRQRLVGSIEHRLQTRFRSHFSIVGLDEILLSAGQTYVTHLINTIMQGPDWKDCAIFLAWDDWGGFYDHVVPVSVDENGYGLRVPGLVISPYAKRGFIDHQTLSFDAFVKFIEDDFHNFASQYQQNPMPVGGSTVKSEWLRYYEPDDLRGSSVYFRAGIRRIKSGGLNDFSACTTNLMLNCFCVLRA